MFVAVLPARDLTGDFMKTYTVVRFISTLGFLPVAFLALGAGCATLPPIAASHPASPAADEAKVPSTSTLARAAQGPLFPPDAGDAMKGMAGMKDGSCGGGG